MVKENLNIGGNVFPRRLDRPLPRAGKAEGVWIEDTEGRRYLDASGGAIVVNVGHGREEIARAVSEQIIACDYIHPTMFTTPVVEALATALAAHTPDGVNRFYFLSGGAEAVETAIKLARQIHLAACRPQKIRLISRWKSYHGLTLGALSAMGRTAFRAPYAPLLSDAVHIPPPYCLRCSYGLQFPECRLRCALALEETILNLGPETVSAFLAETVGGGTLAACPPPEGYFSVVREICDRYDVLLILDEVMCGMGRTGRWFACEHEDVIPDMITLGKGLSGGTVALSAVGVRSTHYDLIREESGGFVHGGTFSHHPVAAAAGLAVVRILERERLVERVARYGSLLGDLLKEDLGDLPWTADVRGIGFLWGIELVCDRKTNTPFDRSEQVTEKIWEAMFQKGVIVYKSTGIAGIHGDALLVAPPFVITVDEMRRIAATLREALLETLGA
ncbi:MAG: aminotransferase class III-fold pyridoxal phosphate-dependent enzyme [Deltaproteobacteria bacterium]|nr:aminotransferase class III-fold pyridoxal phosphate-dependent enzyme [Deltaproteobacteria bacterium]